MITNVLRRYFNCYTNKRDCHTPYAIGAAQAYSYSGCSLTMCKIAAHFVERAKNAFKYHSYSIITYL